MPAYQMQISDDAYKFLVAESAARHGEADWVNVRSHDGSQAKLGSTSSPSVFEHWKTRLAHGKFEYVIADQ